MLSTPAAIATSKSPQAMSRAALLTASRDEQQATFTPAPVMVKGKPASRAQKRPMFRASDD